MAAASRRPPELARSPRFVLTELLLWASIYPAYLAVRGSTIGKPQDAVEHASDLIALERSVDLFHESTLQHLVGGTVAFFSAYYMLGFGPLIAAVLLWLGLRHRAHYRQLRTLLLVSLAIAVVFYVIYPTAPPRLVPSLGIANTVGLSGHDTGSFAGIKFNPYAAMPSMHVGWSLLVGLVGFGAARRRLVKAAFLLHPLVMAVTVTATGNHYFVDSIAGASVALTAVGLVALVRRGTRGVRVAHWERKRANARGTAHRRIRRATRGSLVPHTGLHARARIERDDVMEATRRTIDRALFSRPPQPEPRNRVEPRGVTRA